MAGLSRHRLRRLEVKGGLVKLPRTSPQEVATLAAVMHLTDLELEHLDSALARGLEPEKGGRQDVLVSPAEQAALDRFHALYEEVSRGT
jgi:hypothetical protein